MNQFSKMHIIYAPKTKKKSKYENKRFQNEKECAPMEWADRSLRQIFLNFIR